MLFSPGHAKGLPVQGSRTAVVLLLLGGCYAAMGQAAPEGSNAEAAPSPGYISEVLRDGIEWGTMFERDVNRAIRVNPDQPEPKSVPRYDFGKYAQQYFVSALSPESLVSSVAASATSAAFHSVLHDFTTDDFQRRTAENLTRKGIAGSIDFVTASLLQQDVRFLPSGDHGMGSRVKYALLQTFIARGREGNELAVSRIAASFGTAWVLDTWHPWMRKEPNLWSHAGCIFGSYAARSLWTEFRPDIKYRIQKLLKRNTAILP